METNVKSKSRIAIGIAVVLVLAVISSAFFLLSDLSVKKALNNEKLKNERLLSEKLAVDKENSQHKKTMRILGNKMESLEASLEKTEIKLDAKEKEIETLTRQNSKMKSLQKQFGECRQMNENLVMEVEKAETRNLNLMAENKNLQNSIELLNKENSELAKQIDIVSARNSLKADNYQVEAFKNLKKEKLTLRAWKTKRLVITLDVPKKLANDITFSITTPEGNRIDEKSKSLGLEYNSLNSYQLASLSSMVDEDVNMQQVKLTYQPASRLKGGIYKISVCDKQGELLGNCRFHLK